MAASGRANGHDLGPEAFVHLDVVSAFSRLQSPATPRNYVSALAQQFPLNERTAGDSRPALAICDWGLQSAVKTAVACHRAGVDHLVGLRVRVVPEAAWHPWAEQPRCQTCGRRWERPSVHADAGRCPALLRSVRSRPSARAR